MKRTVLLLAGILLFAQLGRGQGSIFTNLGSDLKRADRLYEQLAFAPAAELYQQVLGRSRTNRDDIKVKLARSYYRMNQPSEAAYWYEQVLAKDSLLSEQDRVYFAQSLAGDQQYDQAKEQYERVSQPWVTEKIAGLESIEKFYEDSVYYQTSYLALNTDAAEFSPAYYQNGLLFVSSRAKQKPVKRVYRWDGNPFLDLYYAPVDSNAAVGTPEPLAGINTKLHEGSVAFLDSGRRMIFTRNSYYEGEESLSSERVNKLNLYSAERADENAAWTNIAPLSFNNPEYSTGHPAVSADGKTLYFVSDAPGGMGGTDLYVSQYDSSGWGAPRNLGEPINTARDEMFPFIAPNGTLYFASAGHAGLGGLDIFRVTLRGEPRNMGYPVNSHHDDFGLIVDSTGQTGYFASNRRRGGADDDLYFVTIDRPQEVLVLGRVVDQEDQEALADVTVAMKASDGEIIEQTTTEADGTYEFEVPAGKVYTVETARDGYQPNEQRVDVVSPSESSFTVENNLARNRIVVEGQVTDLNTKAGADSATVRLFNKTTGKTEDVQTVGEGGTYRFELQPDQRYEIRAGKQQYLGSVDSLVTEGIVNQTVIKNLVLTKVELNEAISLDNIYYDFDKAFLRTSAESELDRLVAFMKENPTYEVELGAHTDARGDDAYNLDLSQRRSESAVNYIVGKGIPRNRITAKGYGESRILNGCTNGVPCSDAQHQQNRRTEFTVVKQ